MFSNKTLYKSVKKGLCSCIQSRIFGWLRLQERDYQGKNRGIEYFKIEQSLPDSDIYEYICVKVGLRITESPDYL